MEIKEIENKLWELTDEELGYLFAEFLGKDYLIQEIIDNLKESEENTEALISILDDLRGTNKWIEIN